MLPRRAFGHVAVNEIRGFGEPVHSGPVVKAVRTPKRRKRVALGISDFPEALALPFVAMTGRTRICVDGTPLRGIGSTIEFAGPYTMTERETKTLRELQEESRVTD